MSAARAPSAALSRILGFGFSIALAFGGPIGVGILRLPGTVAAALGDVRLVIAVWAIGGIYALLGAISIAELAAALPRAGGFYVYARRAFGPTAGFVVGFNDWVLNSLTLSYAATTAAEFFISLVPGCAPYTRPLAIGILVAFTGLHWIGVRIGSGVQNGISALVGVLLVGLALASLMMTGTPVAGPLPPAPVSIMSLPLLSLGMVAALAAALRSVIVTYDGWYTSIYLAEEIVDAARAVPRAMIACALLVTALYLLINIGFVHALSLPVLAASKLPAADVARQIFPHGGAEFVTIVSLCTLLGLINAVLLGTPRIFYAIARDLRIGSLVKVSEGGTPRVALGLTSVAAVLLILWGSLDELIALAAVLFVMNYVSGYSALFTLRWREPGLERPFRALGYPWATTVVLVGSIAFLVAALADDPRSGWFALSMVVGATALGWWTSRRAAPAAS